MSVDEKRIVLADAATANGDYPTTTKILAGGKYTMFCGGTYDGATVTVKATDPVTDDLQALSGGIFNAANPEPAEVTLGENTKISITISAAGASTSLTVTMLPIPR